MNKNISFGIILTVFIITLIILSYVIKPYGVPLRHYITAILFHKVYHIQPYDDEYKLGISPKEEANIYIDVNLSVPEDIPNTHRIINDILPDTIEFGTVEYANALIAILKGETLVPEKDKEKIRNYCYRYLGFEPTADINQFLLPQNPPESE